jgi:alpha-D-ribose 1-methylphosphonate 5-phosphate C-P lyase
MSLPHLLDRRHPVEPHDTYAEGCALCHGIHGFMDRLVIEGIGLRAIHPDCRARMENMGYSIHPERRKA